MSYVDDEQDHEIPMFTFPTNYDASIHFTCTFCFLCSSAVFFLFTVRPHLILAIENPRESGREGRSWSKRLASSISSAIYGSSLSRDREILHREKKANLCG
jgi:hypothetical protein